MEISAYFDHVVMPMIHRKHPQLADQMSILILGSVGLGIDDALSDLEAGLYLDEPLWREQGSGLQLDLNLILEATNPWRKKGSILCVHPSSWLLDGQMENLLSGRSEKAWDHISMEALFTLQENLIYHDPQGLLHRLREMTAPDRYPRERWVKALMDKFLKLVYEDEPEWRLAVLRNHGAEADILWGIVLEDLMELPFLLTRQYYPWRSHLWWALNRSPALKSLFVPALEAIHSCREGEEQVRLVGKALEACKAYIADHALLPGIDMDCEDLDMELLWAQRLGAWKNPRWRDRIAELEKKAEACGFPASQFWVFSLWG